MLYLHEAAVHLSLLARSVVTASLLLWFMSVGEWFYIALNPRRFKTTCVSYVLYEDCTLQITHSEYSQYLCVLKDVDKSPDLAFLFVTNSICVPYHGILSSKVIRGCC